MNAQVQINHGTASDLNERMSIVRHCVLNDDAISNIRRFQDLQSIGFGAAAIRLGYASSEEIDAAMVTSQFPILGEKQASPSSRLIIAHYSDHPRSEKIRLLRTELLLRHDSSDTANIFAVLSPCAAEGRSQLAAELAIAFAQLGRPTLLVDADLRNPQQHFLFGAENAPGLSQALIREQKPDFQTVSGLPSLFLLTAGLPPSNPLELLSDRSFEGMIHEWQQNFDFVILDTPPVGRYADGLAVATIVGRVLSLSRAKRTPYKEERDMMRRLAATRSRILGAVINHF